MKKNSIDDIYELEIPKIISPEGMGSLSLLKKKLSLFLLKESIICMMFLLTVSGEGMRIKIYFKY